MKRAQNFFLAFKRGALRCQFPSGPLHRIQRLSAGPLEHRRTWPPALVCPERLSTQHALRQDPPRNAPGRGRTRDPPLPLNNLRLLLRGWRQQAVKAEVHGGGAVMVGPVVGEGDQCESPRCFAAAPDLNRIAQGGIRYFWHRSIAEIE